ncbi:MAG: serine protein kinase RIO [Candidatus Diapherotrites archaeon]|nr:serine protein kinase RIO [Candidatus Diapherotrites archaeon]MBT4597369.1 serine protein kinase RIO [Candidatus Diapherotrites archaeon]
MEEEDKEDNRIERFVKNKQVKKIFNDVFDKATLDTIFSLARKKYFDEVEFVIATGKEGNVFRCKSGDNYYALKIYKIETSDFKHMMDYIAGDDRFKDVQKNKFNIIEAWTKKEFRNLEEFTKAKIRVPLPIAFKRNCLVMEFIGEDGEAAKRAKYAPFRNMQEKYELMCDYMARMVARKVVHADLSEYNILNNNEEMVIIDVGQGVSTIHPKAGEFFERDIRNLAKWFSKYGVETNYEKMYADIKAKK